ncbi:uncharacterized protein PG998_002847 [Apiospora kogelbergensis]|uniref:uncharacterized protein n=1 Tax=Apiospora kogelbergensis TaxID=1337665 RepID=UPI0031320516
MAILRNHDISDDEFDMLEPEPVSDLLSGASTSTATATPKRGTWDTESYAATPASHDATGSDDQRTYASTFGTNKPTNNEAGRTSEGIPGLKYTKSVYQKLWGGKDALIAVMG